MRKLLSAGAAPGRPEIHDDGLSEKFRKPVLLAIFVIDGKIRRKVHVGVFYARPGMLDAAIAGEHSTGGYLCEIARELEGITPERMTI